MVAIIILLQVMSIAAFGYCWYMTKKLNDSYNELLTKLNESIEDIEDEIKILHEAVLKNL